MRIDYALSDNGKEYKGAETAKLVKASKAYGIGQKFTRINRPQTNGKAERVIRTIMEMWHNKERFSSRKHRHTSFIRFINYYNTVKPHKGIDNFTPYEKLIEYYLPGKTVNNASISNILVFILPISLVGSGITLVSTFGQGAISHRRLVETEKVIQGLHQASGS